MTSQLENELWEAADQLRANSKLTAAEYSMPVLGLIFLRHADNRFKTYLPEIEAGIPKQVPATRREGMIKLGFQGKAAIYLPEAARFDRIVRLPQGAKVGEVIDTAMDLIEADYEILKGALPRGYTAFEPDLLAELVKIFDRPAIRKATGDVFGRIYEYFLNKFAMTGAQEGGEFFTPPSLVRMIVNVIEPDHGLVLDPACGSAGMFVQTGHFIEDVRKQAVNDLVTFHGQEKSDTNTKLARMNLVVHGLDASNIRQGNTFYDQADALIGQCDFVMANPPFNVDGVDTKKVEPQVDEAGRLPFGLPGTNAKTGAISNANSLWIQYFYAYLNAKGRAGFVMASSASDLGNKDRDIREKLVNTGHVDVMIAIGNKFFYTRSLPCTLWFFDKGKPAKRRDSVLMIDARNVYHVMSSRSHVFTEEQLANLTAITWLYRGEQDKFLTLVASYQRKVGDWLAEIPARIAADTAVIDELAALLEKFGDAATSYELSAGAARVAQVDGPPNSEVDENDRHFASEKQLQDFRDELKQAAKDHRSNRKRIDLAIKELTSAKERITKTDLATHKSQRAIQASLEPTLATLKAAQKEIEARHKLWLKLLDKAMKELHSRLSEAFDGKAARELKRAMLAADVSKHEEPSIRDRVLEALKQTVYFIQQTHWLHSRFPEAKFVDVAGLCKAASLNDISANDYSLTPGRYVGVAQVDSEDEKDFVEKMREIHEELADLNDRSVLLASRIDRSFEELLG